MAKRKTKKKPKLSLVSVVLVCFVLFCSVKVVGIQLEISQKEYQLEQLSSSVRKQEEQNRDIEAQIAEGEQNKNESISRIAFEQYGYGNPDEHVYIDSSAS